MKKIAIIIMSLFLLTSCDMIYSGLAFFNFHPESMVVGTWKEQRSSYDDDFLVSTFVFNSDGSGFFMVEGYTNVQKMNFNWKKDGNTIKYWTKGNSSPTTLTLDRGKLIEYSGLSGQIVYKKR